MLPVLSSENKGNVSVRLAYIDQGRNIIGLSHKYNEFIKLRYGYNDSDINDQ